MARAGLKDNTKFRRLVHLLKEPAPHAWGYLECLWSTAYQQRCDRLGDQIDVELAAEYPHEAGKLAAALVASGFVDLVDNVHYVHDLADHAPPYVRRTLRVLNPKSRPQVDHGSTTGRPVVDLDTEKSAFGSTTSLQGRGKGEGEGEGEGREGKSPQPPLAASPIGIAEDLAQRFWFLQIGRKQDVVVLGQTIGEMLRVGYDPAVIRAEIDRPNRDRSEQFFKLKDRLEKAMSSKANGARAGPAALMTKEQKRQFALGGK